MIHTHPHLTHLPGLGASAGSIGAGAKAFFDVLASKGMQIVRSPLGSKTIGVMQRIGKKVAIPLTALGAMYVYSAPGDIEAASDATIDEIKDQHSFDYANLVYWQKRNFVKDDFWKYYIATAIGVGQGVSDITLPTFAQSISGESDFDMTYTEEILQAVIKAHQKGMIPEGVYNPASGVEIDSKLDNWLESLGGAAGKVGSGAGVTGFGVTAVVLAAVAVYAFAGGSAKKIF